MDLGNNSAISKYNKLWGVQLKESTVRSWKPKYCDELRKRKAAEPVEHVSNHLTVFQYCYCLTICGIGAVPGTLQLLSNSSGPYVLVDMVAFCGVGIGLEGVAISACTTVPVYLRK